ncbi:MAG TPA: hypothetical protein VL283_04410 [Candidatus Baltobacteraceae bacterium]|nr:hypothetical protein [Candidatus Baltobacteraceae bacterium]
MKMFALMCALAVAACASMPKPAAKAERPVMRVIVSEHGDRRITFTVDGAWAPLPADKGASDTIVLQNLDQGSSAIAVTIAPADPGSTVEEQVVRMAMMLLSGPMLYAVTDVAKPTYLSDEDGSFTFTGEDKGVPMATKCRVKLASGAGESYWVSIFSVSPMAAHEAAFKEVDRIAESIKVHPATP